MIPAINVKKLIAFELYLAVDMARVSRTNQAPGPLALFYINVLP